MEVTNVNDLGMIGNYGDIQAEHEVLWKSAGVLDLSFRGRMCLAGADRVRFLHGQVTNDVKSLGVGEGCYAALITAKGKIESDLYIYALPEELLLDFEPGLTERITERLERYVIADDVQIIDIAANYGLLSVQGPKSEALIHGLEIGDELPQKALGFTKKADIGEFYLINQPRLGTRGFDVLAPKDALEKIKERLFAAAKSVGGSLCGWDAFEISRIEAGISRYGADLDETINPLEAGLEERAISFNKGCYIGQEVISRIRTYSEAAKKFSGLRLADDLKHLPAKGDKLFRDGKEAGFVTSATVSPRLKGKIALGYVKREVGQVGTELILKTAEGESLARIVELPFVKS